MTTSMGVQNIYIMLLETLKSQAIQRGLLKPEEEIDVKKAFFLVRDMPYTRANSRDSLPKSSLRPRSSGGVCVYPMAILSVEN